MCIFCTFYTSVLCAYIIKIRAATPSTEAAKLKRVRLCIAFLCVGSVSYISGVLPFNMEPPRVCERWACAVQLDEGVAG